MTKKHLESRLRTLRRARTINQAKLAAIIGVSQQTLSKYESGVLVPDSTMQARIAAVLGSTPQELFPAEVVAS